MTTVSSRTPEGQPNRCPVCAKSLIMEPSTPFGDAPCPYCGSLLWFVSRDSVIHYFEHEAASPVRERIRHFLAEQLGVSPNKIPNDLKSFNFKELGADSLDTVEIIMELEEEFGITFDDEDSGGGEWSSRDVA
jgi:acyl carrier protein